jgi:3-oxoacyl-[acyl-carrier protein] reductase
MKTASLEGKVAIVTGGGRGLGHAMTLGLARAACWRCRRT